MYSKALFIYNPMSGNREVPSELDKIVSRFLSKKIILTTIRLEEQMYDELEYILKNFEYDFIIGSGGDGTINAIARNIIKYEIKKTYAVIGTGTCNNFATTIKMNEGLFNTIDKISNMKTKLVDVGYIDDNNTFLSSLAIGIFAQTSFETNSDLKEWLGPFAYYLQAITKLTNIKTNKFVIKTEKEVIEETAYMVLVLNGTSVGNVTNILEDEVDITDGKFELIIVKEMPTPLDIADLIMKVAKGEDFTKSKYIRVETAKYFEIDSDDKELAVSLDGEKGPSLPLKVGIKPKSLNVIMGE